jgi:hypothetical protein
MLCPNYTINICSKTVIYRYLGTSNNLVFVKFIAAIGNVYIIMSKNSLK